MTKPAILLQLLLLQILGSYGAPIDHLIDSPQTIQSRLYPNPYPKGPTENFFIDAPSGTVVQITVLAMDTKPPAGNKCDSSSDNVKIYNSPNKDRSKLMVKLCGVQTLAFPITTSGPYGFIRFKPTGINTVYKGFQIKIDFIDGECGRSVLPDAGQTQLLPQPRIINGIPARDKEYPWQVELIINDAYLCGGCIINDRWILTAGHCVVIMTDLSQVQTRVGSIHIFGGTDIALESVFLHDHYFHDPDGEPHHDVGLLKLAQPLTFSDVVRPICPPLPDQNFEHRRAIASGWGLNENDEFNLVLTAVALNVSTNAFCEQEWSNSVVDITDDMICTHDNGDSTDRDTCGGDSGGPLSVKEADGTFRLAGLVSFGTPVCATGRPGVYARVTEAMDWIQTVLDNN